MENIAAFRECYERWAGWIGVKQGNISKNTIWHQCTEMMNNEFMFQALFLAGKKAAAQPDFHSYLAANAPLYRYLLNGYLSSQYLTIRRLTDTTTKNDEENLKGVTSICRLLDDMKKNSSYITREAFVCVDGLPYDYIDAMEREKEEALAAMQEHSEGGAWMGELSIDVKSLQRHMVFDRLSGVAEEQRQPTDTIAPRYWKRCRKILKQSEINGIRRFVNKYLAHAADEPSLATLNDEDKKQSMQRIHYAQQCLIDLVQRLTFDFYGTHWGMVPTDDEAQLLYNFTKPFVSAEIVEETYQELRRRVQDHLSSL